MRAKLAPDKLSEVEDGIRACDADAAWTYLLDTLSFCLDSKSEMHRRTKILISVPPETTAPLICLAVISAVMNHQDVWKTSQKHVGESEPGLGFLAWRSIMIYRQDEAQANAWFHVVKESARLGHLPSQRTVLAKRFKEARLVERAAIRFQLAFNVLRQGMIERRDIKDRRVAEYFVN